MTENHLRSNQGQFHTTRWSVVARAGEKCERALNDLCSDYWRPLYAYARKRMELERAQDMTQEFFSVLLEKNYVHVADAKRGRFRSFLLTAFKNFLANQHDYEQAIKRGGKLRKLSLDFSSADSSTAIVPTDGLTPEKIFERHWVVTLLENVMARTTAYYSDKGDIHLQRFETLKNHVLGKPDANYAQLATELEMTPDALRVLVHRMRQKYRDLLRAEIAGTVASEDEIDDEIKKLFSIFE